MISPSATKRNIDTQLNGVQTISMGMEVNRKSFDFLFAGLYSDKILAIVRELSSNAHDSHVAAGRADKPFDICLPTAIKPTFAVRDYGTSMTHDDVHNVYSQVLKSPKATTNNQTGMFGVGSKSPLAYADSFILICYLDGQQRDYIIAWSNDDLPIIEYMGSRATSEPDGAKIEFAVKAEDMPAFERATKKVVWGFDVTPRVLGADISVPEPWLQGELEDGSATWSAYEDAGGTFVRQGCVLYPLPSYHVRTLRDRIVITVPIGTYEVTVSREALADADLGTLLEKVDASVDSAVERWLDGHPTEVQKIRRAYEVDRRGFYRSSSYQALGVKRLRVIDPNVKLSISSSLSRYHHAQVVDWIPPRHLFGNVGFIKPGQGWPAERQWRGGGLLIQTDKKDEIAAFLELDAEQIHDFEPPPEPKPKPKPQPKKPTTVKRRTGVYTSTQPYGEALQRQKTPPKDDETLLWVPIQGTAVGQRITPSWTTRPFSLRDVMQAEIAYRVFHPNDKIVYLQPSAVNYYKPFTQNKPFLDVFKKWVNTIKGDLFLLYFQHHSYPLPLGNDRTTAISPVVVKMTGQKPSAVLAQKGIHDSDVETLRRVALRDFKLEFREKRDAVMAEAREKYPLLFTSSVDTEEVLAYMSSQDKRIRRKNRNDNKGES